MKRIVLTIAALVVASLSFAQEYIVLENNIGGLARYDVSLIKQAYFKSFAAEGQGTEASPFNVAAANLKCKEIGETPSTEKYYIKGTLSTIYRSYSTTTASFYIADDETGINRIFVNEVASPVPVADMKKGDEIIVYGSLYNYNNLTPEIAPIQIVSYNGQKYEIVEPSGTGTADDPYNVAGVIAAMQNLERGATTTENIYVKAYVAEVSSFIANYGNITYYICDLKNGMSQRFYVYRGLGLGGAKFTSENDIKAGDEVVICGKITNYNGTIEFAQNNYLVQLNDQTAGGGSSTSGLNTDFTAGIGDWVIKDVVKPEALTYIWQQTAQYGMKASAYLSGKNYATESWLVSPSFTLTAAATMTFSQAQRYSASGCTDLHVMYSTTYTGGDINASEWTEVTPSAWPDGTNWNFIDCTAAIPATAKYVAFRYTSTDTAAGTWEIKTVKIE